MSAAILTKRAEWLDRILESRHLASSWIQAGLATLRRSSASIESPSRFSQDSRDFSAPLGLGAVAALEEFEPGRSQIVEGLVNVVDMFSGCGGMSLGFEAVSRAVPAFNVIGALDIDRSANLTYSANFGVSPSERDIRCLAGSRSEARKFLERCRGYSPKAPLVLIGCAPCQGFTSHRKKLWHRADRRNSLVEEFAEVAALLKPDAVLMENVPEMLSKRYWRHFESARNRLLSVGYHVRQTIYNCADFGVPQERFRAVVIAMRRPFAMPVGFLGIGEYLTVREAIGRLAPIRPGEPCAADPLHMTARHRRETLRTIGRVPKDGGSRPPGVGPKCLDRVKGFYDVYGRLAWNRPAITITHYARNPASGRYVHPEQNRGLSVREAALLQTFPNRFEFKGTFDEKFSQIGNAVPPRLACFLAAQILCELAAKSEPAEDEREPRDIFEPVSSSFSSVIAGLKLRRNGDDGKTADRH